MQRYFFTTLEVSSKSNARDGRTDGQGATLNAASLGSATHLFYLFYLFELGNQVQCQGHRHL